MRKVVIGSRGSDLALWQANHVKAQIEKLGLEVEIKIIITQGDAIQNLSFDKLEGKGYFTKEIENELLAKTVDIAVHSHKDLETNPPAGLMIGAVSERENPAELLLIAKNKVDATQKWNLASNASIGTSSARRKALVLAYRSDLEIKELRGNVPTRIQKLRDGNYDAILLAKAGVDRLKIDLSEFHVEVLDPTEFVPAPAQGVLGLQIREDDDFMKSVLRNLNNRKVKSIIDIERKVLNLMDGGCQLPLGVYCPDVENAYVAYSKSSTQAAQNFHFDLTKMTSPSEEIVSVLKAL
ncbi:MAG: hydroxymethylbilane synthase [Flavobacteriia bacterium]|jgi:hydroxymethylbilane synthase